MDLESNKFHYECIVFSGVPEVYNLIGSNRLHDIVSLGVYRRNGLGLKWLHIL